MRQPRRATKRATADRGSAPRRWYTASASGETATSWSQVFRRPQVRRVDPCLLPLSPRCPLFLRFRARSPNRFEHLREPTTPEQEAFHVRRLVGKRLCVGHVPDGWAGIIRHFAHEGGQLRALHGAARPPSGQPIRHPPSFGAPGLLLNLKQREGRERCGPMRWPHT